MLALLMVAFTLLTYAVVVLLSLALYAVVSFAVGRKRSQSRRRRVAAAFCAVAAGLSLFHAWDTSAPVWSGLACFVLLMVSMTAHLWALGAPRWPALVTALLITLAHVGLSQRVLAHGAEAMAELRRMDANPALEWCRKAPKDRQYTEDTECIGPAMAAMGLEWTVQSVNMRLAASILAVLAAIGQWLLVPKSEREAGPGVTRA